MKATATFLHNTQRTHHSADGYRGVMRALGYSKNADAMTDLARRTPLDLLRSQNNMQDIEALLFGISGLLPDVAEMLQTDRHSVEYVVDLRDRFERLRQTTELRPMRDVAWQYFRLRPSNFPTRRIAQAVPTIAYNLDHSSSPISLRHFSSTSSK